MFVQIFLSYNRFNLKDITCESAKQHIICNANATNSRIRKFDYSRGNHHKMEQTEGSGDLLAQIMPKEREGKTKSRQSVNLFRFIRLKSLMDGRYYLFQP